MVVASANEFRINQKKYLDLVRKNIQVFLKQGNELFAITTVSEEQHIDFNPVWVEHAKKGMDDIKAGRVTKIKSDEIWEKVSDWEKDHTH